MRSESPKSLPIGVSLLVGLLFASPLFHGGAVLAHVRFLNFGSGSWWNHFIYWGTAPFVALLLVKRHERARFSLYIFLSCEAYRGLATGSPALIALAVLGIAYFQLRAVRAIYPRIVPGEVISRISGRIFYRKERSIEDSKAHRIPF